MIAPMQLQLCESISNTSSIVVVVTPTNRENNNR